MIDDEFVLKVPPKYTHRKRLDSFFWSFAMSMFSIVAKGESSKRTVRVESINLKFGPDPEFEPEVMIRLKRVGVLLNALDPSNLHYDHKRQGIANIRGAPIFLWF